MSLNDTSEKGPCLCSFHSYKWDVGVWVFRTGFYYKAVGEDLRWIPMPVVPYNFTVTGRVQRGRKIPGIFLIAKSENQYVQYSWEHFWKEAQVSPLFHGRAPTISRLESNCLDDFFEWRLILQLEELSQTYPDHNWTVPRPRGIRGRALDILTAFLEGSKLVVRRIIIDGQAYTSLKRLDEWEIVHEHDLGSDRYQVMDIHPTLGSHVLLQQLNTTHQLIYSFNPCDPTQRGTTTAIPPRDHYDPELGAFVLQKQYIQWTRLGYVVSQPHQIEFWDSTCWKALRSTVVKVFTQEKALLALKEIQERLSTYEFYKTEKFPLRKYAKEMDWGMAYKPYYYRQMIKPFSDQ